VSGRIPLKAREAFEKERVATCDAQGACLGRYLGATGRVERLRTAWRKQRTDRGADMFVIASLS